MFSRNIGHLLKRSSRLWCRVALPTVLPALFDNPSYHVRERVLLNKRFFATPPPQLNTSELSNEQYHVYSDTTMEALLDSLENIVDEIGDPNHEVEYSSGVLNLKLGDKGTYVINKQPPNKQIWLSSPVSGPKRYDYMTNEDRWVYGRDQRSLGELLNSELSKALSREVDLGLDKVIKRQT